MSNVDVVRAWKDETYRNSLSEAERAALPPNPAGEIELAEADLSSVVAGASKPGGGGGGGGGTGTGRGTGGNCSRVACCRR